MSHRYSRCQLYAYFEGVGQQKKQYQDESGTEASG